MDIQQPSAHSSETVAASPGEAPFASEHSPRTSPAVAPWWRSAWVPRLALVLILVVGAYFRTLSLTTWDGGTGQHPDERFFSNVASTVRVPATMSEYFDSARSPGNPRSYDQFPLFVYGPFPITLTRLTAVMLTPNEALPETVPSISGPPGPRADGQGGNVTRFGPMLPNPERAIPKLSALQLLFNPDGQNLTSYNEIVKVGRSLAVIFDLASILLVYLIARRLFDRRVGLLAALLASLTVMQIQQSHFFVDPIFSTFFALLALYWAVRVAQGGGWLSYAALGVSIGCAMANRVTMATLGLVAIVAAILAALRVWRAATYDAQQQDIAPAPPDAEDGQRTASFTAAMSQFFTRSLPLLMLAGALTLLTYRTLQPDAFIGSQPSSPPVPGDQLTRLEFMAGWGFFDVRPDPRFLRNLSEVRAFVTGEIDWPPSQQWVHRAAYLFPWQNMVLWGMGPFLGLAAWISWLYFIADCKLQIANWRRRTGGNLQVAICNLQLLPALVLWVWAGFYFAWQGAQFAITLRYLLPIYGALIIFAAWGLVRLWDARRPAHDTRAALRPSFFAWLRRLPSIVYLLPLLAVVAGTFGWAYAFTRIYERPHSRVMAAQWLIEHAPPGSKIAFERWDDPLPLQVSGNNLWNVVYQGVETSPYAEDDPQKYLGSFNGQNQFEPGLIDALDEADYLTLTSNRVYDSATRMPYRYPALTRYYYHLFKGDLGFELVADVSSYPRLLGIEIPDQRAEEAFSVYDHPRVLIFKKTPDFSRERATELLTSDMNWGEVYKLPVIVADKTTTALRLTESQWPAYRAAGTWTALFNPQSLANTLAPLTWLLVLELLGLATFALLFRLLPWLPDRGFALARALGVLLVAYAAWVLGSLRIAAFTPLTVWLCVLPLLLAGAWAAWRWRAELRAFWQERRGALLMAWGIYLGFFALGLALRWFNPDLWHPARGGEKPMDIAYLNAVLKSAAFPPYDPWHAGGYINYYYFGFVIVGALIHLTTVVPSVAYNLAVPTLFALTALGAWGVVYNLLAPRTANPSLDLRAGEGRGTLDDDSSPAPTTVHRLIVRERSARLSALLAPVFMLLLGNLAQAFWFIDGYAAKQAARPEWAFWDATRIVQGTVNEFPFFTFLFADLHAHMIVMPFSLALLGLCVALVRRPRDERPGTSDERWLLSALRRSPFVFVLLLLGLLAGTLRATNTWDYPTYVGLTVATLALIGWRHAQRAQGIGPKIAALLRFWVLPAALVLLLGNLLFLPFTRNFVTESSGLELLRDGQYPSQIAQILNAERTSLWDLLRMYGLWLFLLGSAGLALARRLTRADGSGALLWSLAGAGGALTLAGVFAGWSAPLLLVPLLLGAAWLAWRLRYLPPRLLLPLLWGGTALALCLMVDLVVVKGDVGRMNTVFKFGLHAWTLFALAAAVALPWLFKYFGLPKSNLQKPEFKIGLVWSGAALLLIAAAAVYPLTATPARLADRYAEDLPHTLDGLAFLRSDAVTWSENGRNFPLAEDAEGIAWLQQNVQGTPVILEAQLPSYRWAGRVATFTGLPTVLGWEWHQIQQRMAVRAEPIIRNRQADIAQIYNSSDIVRALELIKSYGIEYIYVGGVERAIYDAQGIAKFAAMAQRGQLELAFSNGNTTIYRVAAPGTPTMLTTDLPVRPPTLDTPPPLLLDRPVNRLPAVGGYAWNSWASANSWLAAFVWLIALYVLALLGLPAAVLVLGRWRDGGFAWARLIGMLLLGYAVWMPTSLGLWHYDGGGMLGGLVLVLALNVALLAWLGRLDSRHAPNAASSPIRHGLAFVVTHLRARRRAVLISEGLFLAGFIAFTLIRALNPDLWQPIFGGEKPMGFGFLNAILRSPVMPPYDPFFSDGYINYYYYGLYLISLPIKLTGIAPAVAFNLAVPTLFALTLVGGYAIVAQLTGKVRYGLLGAAFLALLGNLGSVLNLKPAPEGLSPIASLFQPLAPLANALDRDGLSALAHIGQAMGDAWFWNPSRIIPYTINEFPFWSFLFADLHPHLIALPITLLAIALAYQTLDASPWTVDENGPPAHRLSSVVYRLFLLALTLGTLAVTNSWDFPTYTLLVGAALLGAAWRAPVGLGARLLQMGRAAMLTVLIAGGGLLLYMPFFDNFYAFVKGIGTVQDFTSVPDFLTLYGLFAALLLPLVLGAAWRIMGRRTNDLSQARALRMRRAAFAGALAVLVVFALAVPALGLRLWLGALLALLVMLLLQRRISATTWFIFLLMATGLGVSLGIETVYIRDHLADGDWYRMNTVFKFGMQIWALLALAAAASLPLVLRGLRRLGQRQATGAAQLRLLPMAYGALLVVLMAFAAVFTLIGTPNRLANRFPITPAPTLDGLAFLRTASFEYDCRSNGGCEPGVERTQVDLSGDADAIAWLNKYISGTPIVLQSNQWFYRAYGVRIAANTGLPTVISALHANEQRDPFLTGIRDRDVDELFRTNDKETTLRLLVKYRVNYIYVGGVERAFYNEAGLRKFDTMRDAYLDVVYDNLGVQIYKVRGIPEIYAAPQPATFAQSPPPAQPQSEPQSEPQQQPVQPQSGDSSPADLQALEATIAANPGNGPAAFGLAERYRSLNRLDDAARVLSVAAAANPNDIGLHHLWGDILSQAQRYDEAEQAYLQATKIDPSAGNWNKLGTALLLWGKLDKAELALNQALVADAQSPDPYYRLGQLYKQQGNRERAVEELTTYLTLAPDGQFNAEVRKLLQELKQ